MNGKPYKPLMEASLPEGWPAPTAPGEIVVKSYPASRLAVVEQAGQNAAFSRLFDHIKGRDIAMTAPVEMTYAEQGGPEELPRLSQQSMAFYYRSPSQGQAGQEGDVRVVDVPPTTVVSVGVKGSYREANFAKALQRLTTWLAQNGRYERTGPPRVLAYNSPFVPWFLKYAEVQLPIREKP